MSSEELQAEIAALFCGETVGDCLDALCRQFAACVIVAADDIGAADRATAELAARTRGYIHAYLAAIERMDDRH